MFGHFGLLFCSFFGGAAARLEMPKNTAKNTLSPACLLDLRYGQKATKTNKKRTMFTQKRTSKPTAKKDLEKLPFGSLFWTPGG